jgi:signal transduction histidine kinase
MMRRVFLYFLFLPFWLSAQSPKDSAQIKAIVDTILGWKVSDPEKGRAKTAALIQKCKSFPNKKYLAQAYMLMGLFYDDVADYRTTKMYYDSSFSFYKKMNYALGIGQYYNNVGLISKKQSLFPEAVSAFTSGFRIADSLGNERLISQLSNNLGILYNDMEQPAKAVPYLERAAAIHKKNDNVEKLGMVYQNLAVSYELLNDFKKAIHVYQLSIKASESIGDSAILAYSYDNLGGLYFKQKQYAKAYDLHAKALNIAIAVEDKAQLALIYNNLSMACSKLEKRNEQLETAEKALKLSEETSSTKEKIRAFGNLSLYYQETGNVSEALKYKQKENDLIVTLFSENTAEATSESMVKYETEKKEKEKELLAQKNKIIELELENKERQNASKTKTIIILIVLFLLTALTIVFILLYNRVRRQKQHLEALANLRDERERISRDLHDNIGSQVSFIIHNLEWMQQELATKGIGEQNVIHSVNTAGRDLMQSIRETIWALKNDKITVENFGDRVYSSLKKYNDSPHIKVRVKQNIKQNNSISALESLNLLRIIQEAVNNAFKYSQSREILIDIEAGEHYKYFVRVKDNGIGMNMEQAAEKESYGLDNMKHRAQEIGADLIIESEPGKGTVITIKKELK